MYILCSIHDINNNRSINIITELHEEHFEVHDQNKAERYEKQKFKFLEDRIKTLGKSVERLHRIVGTMDRYKEDNDDQGNIGIITEEIIMENKNAE